MKTAYINSRLEIEPGQTYLHVANNEYVIVTKFDQTHVTWAGIGFYGKMDGYDFIEKFPPVEPTNIDPDECQALLALCPDWVEEATTGFICEYDLHDLDAEFEEEEA